MRTTLRAATFATMAVGALALAACSGRTADDVDGGGSSHPDGGGDAGFTCEPPPGCTAISATQCSDGCNTCSCVRGEWGCTLMACVDSGPATCPATPPQRGYCANEGLSCSYGDRCGEQCVCVQHAWQCAAPPCVPPTCPSVPPPAGSQCSQDVGLTCKWGPTCNETQCQCVASQNGPPAWQCAGTACVDAGMIEAGHTGDGGH